MVAIVLGLLGLIGPFPLIAELNNYGVLKARLLDRLGSGPHYQIHAIAGQDHYRVAFNTASQSNRSQQLRVAIIDPFDHAIIAFLKTLPEGQTPLPSESRNGLDYIRGGLFQIAQTQFLDAAQLGTRFDLLIGEALKDPAARVYAFGEFWGPEVQPDKFFGFKPGRGVHDLHLNQGNPGQFAADDGVYQDGGLLFEIPSGRKWWAVFAMFQSQSLTTHDDTGHAPTPNVSTLPGATPPPSASAPAENDDSLATGVGRTSAGGGIRTILIVGGLGLAAVAGFVGFVRFRAPRAPRLPIPPSPPKSPLQIFISYRSEDRAPARLVRDRIRACQALSEAKIFLDVESLRAGAKYRDDIQRSIDACQVFIALIGPAWIERIAELQKEEDFVRFEIAYALQRDVAIIPVAIEGARVPAASELPAGIAGLSALQHLSVPDSYFDEGMKKLCDRLTDLAATAPVAAAQV